MAKKAYDYMNWRGIEAIVYSEESSPRDMMAPRVTPDGILIQCFVPGASSVCVLAGKKSYPMELMDDAGYYAVLIKGKKIPDYVFTVQMEDKTATVHDPYAFPELITEEDEKAFLSGVWYKSYEKLGAHPMTISGVSGTNFAVWAPNAMRVSVVGDFNGWDGRTCQMHRHPMSGIYELFVPEVGPGSLYQYEIKTGHGQILMKSDPYSFVQESYVTAASKVGDYTEYDWKDLKWMCERNQYTEKCFPVNILQTSLADWKSPEELLSYVKKLKYTHVQLAPVMEFLGDSEGYPTFSFFAFSTRYGSAEGFQNFVNQMHQEGIGVILDWAPAQFQKHVNGLECFDGTRLYESEDVKRAEHPIWNQWLFNVDSPMVQEFLISNVLYWAEVFHVDGVRVDDVDVLLYLDYYRAPGEWSHNIYGGNENIKGVELLKTMNSVVKRMVPGFMTIAQEDGLWPQVTGSGKGQMGFDYKWDNGWTSDLLYYGTSDPGERGFLMDYLTSAMLYHYCEDYMLAIGKRDIGDLDQLKNRLPGSELERQDQLRALLAYQMVYPGAKMSVLGCELSEKMTAFLSERNDCYKNNPALFQMDGYSDGFEWISLGEDDQPVIAFARYSEDKKQTLVVVCNFTQKVYEQFHVGLPSEGKYKEIFNSDQVRYGGDGIVNPRAKQAVKKSCDARDYSLTVKIPAYGIAVFAKQ